MLTCSLLLIAILSMASAAAPAVPNTLSMVKQRQVFKAADFVYDFNNPTSDSTVAGVRQRPLTEKEMPALDLLLELEQIQYRVVDLAPCSASALHVAPTAPEFILGRTGVSSVGVVRDGKPILLNDVGFDQGTFFPKGMVHFEINQGCVPGQFFAAVSSTLAKADIPEANLANMNANDIAALFQVSNADAAQLLAAAKANKNVNPLTGLISQCKAKCGNGGGNAPATSVQAKQTAAPAKASSSSSSKEDDVPAKKSTAAPAVKKTVAAKAVSSAVAKNGGKKGNAGPGKRKLGKPGRGKN